MFGSLRKLSAPVETWWFEFNPFAEYSEAVENLEDDNDAQKILEDTLQRIINIGPIPGVFNRVGYVRPEASWFHPWVFIEGPGVPGYFNEITGVLKTHTMPERHPIDEVRQIEGVKVVVYWNNSDGFHPDKSTESDLPDPDPFETYEDPTDLWPFDPFETF